MMRNKNFTSKKLFFIIIILFLQYVSFAQDSTQPKWTIAALKFEYAKGQSQNAVTQATATSLPSDILEKMNKTLERNVYPDEKLERTRYKLRTERQSLYLQLTSEYNKRDAIVLNNYSQAKLEKSIKDQEKKIGEIQNKIDENLQTLKEEEERLEKQMIQATSFQSENENPEQSEFSRLKQMAKRIFTKKESVITQENVCFYQDNINALYNPSEADLIDGYTGYRFEKSVVSAGINTLLTGKITQYGEYISVEVQMYVYPGAKKIASVIEMGGIQDLELITTSIANQLIPHLTNAMPVMVAFSVNSENEDDYLSFENVELYIDDVLQKTDGKKLELQSGVHSIQFACKGYKTAETSYYFEGNKSYNVDVILIPRQEGEITIQLKKYLDGELLVNGAKTDELNFRRTTIKINGNSILGEFIAEDGQTAYFYVPEKYIEDGAKVIINPKPFDRDKYIDTRRKWMYGAYSALMVSLIPYFYTSGNLTNYAQLYNEGQIPYDEAIKWQKANNICAGISIGCGVFWGVELVRYFIAANSVLPQKAKKGK